MRRAINKLKPSPANDLAENGAPDLGMLSGKERTREPRVWDCHAGNNYPADAVYVGCRVRNRKGGVIREGSIFGNGTNPLESHHGSLNNESAFRAYAIEKLKDPAFRQQAHQLKGKDLLCWCAQEGKRRAQFCHARVWFELINREALYE